MEICAATDLSPAGDAAVALALRWAEAHGATAVLLHVVHDPVLAPALADDVPGDTQRARAALEALAARANVPCHVEVRTAEDVASTIVAASRGAAYLIVGSHGKSGWQRLRLGSVATAVLRQSHVPVVCLPAVASGA